MAPSPQLSPWLVRPVSRLTAALRLFCVPYAGVGPSAFRGWAQSLPPSIEVLHVLTPGRESRLRETAVANVAALAHEIASAIAPFSHAPFALFGHSLGGLIAFEVARALREEGLGTPVRLFASACRAPHVPYPFEPLHRLDEEQLLLALNDRYDGSVPKEVMEDRELRALLVPALRADLTALETYQHRRDRPLDCPISVFGGTLDRTIAREALTAWSAHSTRAVRLRLFEGGHFYLQSGRQALLSEITADLSTVLMASMAGGV